MIKGNKEKPPPQNKSEILRVCIQLYPYHDRKINETALSVGELYHKIFGNDGILFSTSKGTWFIARINKI